MCRKRTYIVKEVTCPRCDGQGYLEDEYNMIAVNDEEYKCPVCDGQGYTTLEVDNLTGFRVVTIQ